MAIPDFVNATTFISNGVSPVTFGGSTHTSGSGTHRAIGFFVVTRDNGAQVTVSSFTWNGVALTDSGMSILITDATTANRRIIEFWYILAPDASTAGALSLSLSNAVDSVIVHAINIEGPTGPLNFGTTGSGSDDADPGTTAFSGTINPAQNDSLILACVSQDTVTATASWDTLTEIAETGSGGSSTRVVTAYGDQAVAGSTAYEGDWDTQNEWAMGLVSFYETAGDPPAPSSIKGSALRSSVLSPHAFGQGYAI